MGSNMVRVTGPRVFYTSSRAGADRACQFAPRLSYTLGRALDRLRWATLHGSCRPRALAAGPGTAQAAGRASPSTFLSGPYQACSGSCQPKMPSPEFQIWFMHIAYLYPACE
jgi:hypothetical protein